MKRKMRTDTFVFVVGSHFGCQVPVLDSVITELQHSDVLLGHDPRDSCDRVGGLARRFDRRIARSTQPPMDNSRYR